MFSAENGHILKEIVPSWFFQSLPPTTVLISLCLNCCIGFNHPTVAEDFASKQGKKKKEMIKPDNRSKKNYYNWLHDIEKAKKSNGVFTANKQFFTLKSYHKLCLWSSGWASTKQGSRISVMRV